MVVDHLKSVCMLLLSEGPLEAIANEHRRCCHEVFFGDGGVGEGVQWQDEHLLKLGQFSGQVISPQI